MYSDRSDSPSTPTPPARAATPETAPSEGPLSPETALKMLEAIMGPGGTATATAFGRHLANTIAAWQTLATANPQPESGGWLFYEAEIDGAVSGLTGMAEAVQSMLAANSPLLHAGMLEHLPTTLLARVLVAGFLVIAEDLLDHADDDLAASLEDAQPETEAQ